MLLLLRHRVRTLTTLLGAMSLALPAWPCSCVPSFLTPCEDYWRAKAVFVGRVISSEPRSLEEVNERLRRALPPELAERVQDGWTPDLAREVFRRLLSPTEYAPLVQMPDRAVLNAFEHRFSTRRVRIAVTEPFRGIDEKEVEFTSDFSSCSVDFRENESYLVYAWREQKTGRLETGVCAGTRRVDQAAQELKYIRGIRTGETPSRIFGFVTKEPQDIQLPARASKPVAGVEITARAGEKVWTATSTPEGRYELVGLPPGSYDLRAALPGTPADQASRRVDIVAGQCLSRNFLAIAVGAITGRLIDQDGKPIRGALTEIQAVPPTPQPRPAFRKGTGEDGRFEHTQLPAGEYVIGFNIDKPPNARDWYGNRTPYPPSYYPGVTKREDAQVLRLRGGERIEDLEYRVPRAGKELVISGVVVWPDGSPANSVVWLVDLDFPPDTCKVDRTATAGGRFSLAGVEGRRYAVFAHVKGQERHLHSEIVEAPPAGQPIRLILSALSFERECEICRRFPHL